MIDSKQTTLGWFSIFRLGLVQACLGAIVVIMTSTLNRLMVVELSMAATIPGFFGWFTLRRSTFSAKVGINF